MLPGKKVTRGMLDDLCAQLSGVERKGWKVKRTCKAKQGWFWFNIARGAQGEQRAYALYGKGRRGMYAMLLLTDPAGARKHRGAIALGEGRQVAPAARSSGEGGEEALNG